MIAALFVETDGIYFGLEGVDPWDVNRDARNYKGPHPVIAHPPCNRWSVLAYSVQARYPHCKVGDDDGCFEDALMSVWAFGGVLEHPARSLAFEHYGLPKPRSGSWQPAGPRQWVTQVSQAAYGHLAQKFTWLYYVGDVAPPALDWGEPEVQHQVSYGKNPKTGTYWKTPLTTKQAKATPPAFLELLIELATISQESLGNE